MVETLHQTIPMSGGAILILAEPQEVGCQTWGRRLSFTSMNQ